MGKVLSIPPPIPKSLIDERGRKVQVKDVRIIEDQWTSIGTTKFGFGFAIEIDDQVYSQMFSLDKSPITGSAGRILVSLGIDDTSQKDFKAKLKALEGKELTVRNIGGKLYWYP